MVQRASELNCISQVDCCLHVSVKQPDFPVWGIAVALQDDIPGLLSSMYAAPVEESLAASCLFSISFH